MTASVTWFILQVTEDVYKVWINGVEQLKSMANNRPGVEYFTATGVDMNDSRYFTFNPIIMYLVKIGGFTFYTE